MTYVKHLPVTIANGASESGEFYADDALNLLVHVPSGFTGSVAVQIKSLAGTWDYLRYTGLEGNGTAHAVADIPAPAGGWTKSGWYMFPSQIYAGATLRLKAHASEVAQAQTGAQALEVLMKGA